MNVNTGTQTPPIARPISNLIDLLVGTPAPVAQTWISGGLTPISSSLQNPPSLRDESVLKHYTMQRAA